MNKGYDGVNGVLNSQFPHLGDKILGIPRAIGDGRVCDCWGSFVQGSEKLVVKEIDCLYRTATVPV